MNFTSYVDRQRQAIRAAQFSGVAFECVRQVLPAGVAVGAAAESKEDGRAAQYFERLSAKLFEELNALRGFRREEGEAYC